MIYESRLQMKEQLRELVVRLRTMADAKPLTCGRLDGCADEIEAILSASQPSVSVKPGWVAKCIFGLTWFPEKPRWYKDTWVCEAVIAFLDVDIERIVTDPWPDKPNGGPECIIEVKP